MSAQTAAMQYSALDSDKVLTFVLRNDEKLKEDSLVFFQFAMLYTDSFGVRRIMILNYMWRVSKTLYAYFKSSDCEAAAQFKIRYALSNSMLLGAKRVKEKMINDLVEMLYNYKKHCGQSTNPSQLLLPETLKNFPLLILSALKSPVRNNFTYYFRLSDY